jgi:hypothetical protein
LSVLDWPTGIPSFVPFLWYGSTAIHCSLQSNNSINPVKSNHATSDTSSQVLMTRHRVWIGNWIH